MDSPWLVVRNAVAVPTAKGALLALIAGVSAVALTTSAPPDDASAGAWPAAAPRSFTIDGFATVPLAPAVTSPVQLLLTNPHGAGLTVTTLDVQIGEITAASGRGPCGRHNFDVRQFTGRYGFVVGAGRTMSFGELGIATAQWPQLVMRDLPVNQDSCKGATLTLKVTGEATAA